MSHLLPLSNLHAAAPGVLDIVFGPDGDFEGAPYWVGPVSDIDPSGVGGIYHVAAVLSGGSVATIEGAGNLPLYSVALDLRIPSVAARLAGLCAKAAPDADTRRQLQIMFGDLRKPVSAGDAVALASLTLTLAPRIAALGGNRG